MSRVGEMDTAYAGRSPAFDVNINGVWLPEEAEGAPDHVAWVRSLFGELEPSARGVYVNFLGDEGADRVRAAYGAEKYERLVELKTRWDPTNLFRSNQNIAPGRLRPVRARPGWVTTRCPRHEEVRHDGHDRHDEGLRLRGALQGGGRRPPDEGSDAREAPGPLERRRRNASGSRTSCCATRWRSRGPSTTGSSTCSRSGWPSTSTRTATARSHKGRWMLFLLALGGGVVRADAPDARRTAPIWEHGVERDRLTARPRPSFARIPAAAPGATVGNDGLRPHRARVHRRPVPGLRRPARA